VQGLRDTDAEFCRKEDLIPTIADSDLSVPHNAVMAGEGRPATPLFIHKKGVDGAPSRTMTMQERPEPVGQHQFQLVLPS
jgi:hypothetical protein